MSVGGALQQHVPDVVGHDEHSPGVDSYGTSGISVAPESQVHRLIGGEVEVALPPPPGGERAIPVWWPAPGRADGTVEAIEDPGSRFRIGVQWHPETADDQGLFAGLVAAASRVAPAALTPQAPWPLPPSFLRRPGEIAGDEPQRVQLPNAPGSG